MYKELDTLGVPDIKYFSLRRKNDGKEVYTSPCYMRGGNNDVLDIERIVATLDFYINRVNSGIEQQMQSPKLTDEQKKELKMLTPEDFNVFYMKFMPVGMAEHIYWKKEYSDWSNIRR